MTKAHNVKTMKFTTAPVRKVGRPTNKFLCEICKERKRTEMKTMHAPGKRNEARSNPKSSLHGIVPPVKKLNMNKKVRNLELEKREQENTSLKLKNVTLAETAEKRQEQLTKQANIISELRAGTNKLEIEKKERDDKIEIITHVNNELVDTLVLRNDTIKYLEENQTAQGALEEVEDAPGAQTEDITTLQASKNSGYNRAGPQNGARPETWFSSKGHKNEDLQPAQKQTCTECPETRSSEAHDITESQVFICVMTVLTKVMRKIT